RTRYQSRPPASYSVSHFRLPDFTRGGRGPSSDPVGEVPGSRDGLLPPGRRSTSPYRAGDAARSRSVAVSENALASGQMAPTRAGGFRSRIDEIAGNTPEIAEDRAILPLRHTRCVLSKMSAKEWPIIELQISLLNGIFGRVPGRLINGHICIRDLDRPGL